MHSFQFKASNERAHCFCPLVAWPTSPIAIALHCRRAFRQTFLTYFLANFHSFIRFRAAIISEFTFQKFDQLFRSHFIPISF